MSFEELREWVETPKVRCINHHKMQMVMQSYDVVKKMILSNDQDAILEIAEGALRLGSVSIKITTVNLTVYNMEKFREVVKSASNFEIYPRTDDRIQINILFENVISYTFI